MKLLRCVIVLVSILAFTGCMDKESQSAGGEPTLEGYILDIQNGKVLVAYNISNEKFHEIKDKSIKELSNNAEHVPLIYLSYDDTDTLNKGNKVKVWMEGGIDDSYPQQAGAKVIKVEN
jgi:hypothetical protein